MASYKIHSRRSKSTEVTTIASFKLESTLNSSTSHFPVIMHFKPFAIIKYAFKDEAVHDLSFLLKMFQLK